MKKLFHLIIIILLGTLSATGQNIHKDYFDGEVYIKIKSGVPLKFTQSREVNIYDNLSFLTPFIPKYKISTAHASFYFAKSDTLKRIFRIYFSSSPLVEQFLTDLKKLNQVEYAEKVPIMRLDYSPADLLPNAVNGQYNLYNIKAREAWDVARGNSSVVIAVVDNAVGIFHPDLNPNVVPASHDVADGDLTPTPPDPRQDWGHGTHAAGIACAATDNGIGIASISFNCGLMGIKATRDGATNILSLSHAYEGITWATEHGAKIISCSFGSTVGNQAARDVINNAHARNVIVVAAAGNHNASSLRFPAAFDHVVSVASVNINDIKTGTSGFGNTIDVSAPGDAITSTIPHDTLGLMGGTSMACPLVAGLCGLVWSLNPGLSNDEVVNCIKNSTDNIDAQNPGFIGQLGAGRINAFKAVECALVCNPSINLGSGIYTVLKTQSSGTITAANTIPSSARVAFDAAVSVILQPGFTAVNGSNFHAYIDGCGGAFRQASPAPGTVPSKKTIIKEESKTMIVKENMVKVYPNPSRDKFNVSYQLSSDAHVSISIYSSDMALIKQLTNRTQPAGTYIEVFDAANLATGIYFAKIATGSNVQTIKLVVMH